MSLAVDEPILNSPLGEPKEYWVYEEGQLKSATFMAAPPLDIHDVRKIKKLLEEWYKEHALVICSRRLDLLYESARKLTIHFPKIQLRKMSRRWGSCSKFGNISLNTETVKTPLMCIDYVIMHELCHLKMHTHTNGYYKLLSKYMPDWRKRKERLEQAGMSHSQR